MGSGNVCMMPCGQGVGGSSTRVGHMYTPLDTVTVNVKADILYETMLYPTLRACYQD